MDAKTDKSAGQCPFNHACMKQVTSAMVVDRVRKILSIAKNRPEVIAALASAAAE